jgi:PTS system N-acetylglucosamine-specific IIC component
MLLSMALTSFLTGVTEPVEFAFLFLAPRLFALHAVLTGVAMAVMHALHVRLGFTFSAGAFDYLLSYGLSSRGWLLLPIGALYFGVYYGAFRYFIRRFDLETPGRETERVSSIIPTDAGKGPAFIYALGGAANLLSVDACTTRLRLKVADASKIDETALKSLGAKGVVHPAAGSVQVVLGPEAELVSDAIRASMARAPSLDPSAWLAGLGGLANLRSVEAVATTRLRAEVVDAARLDEAALMSLGAKGVMRFSSTLVHVVLGPESKELAASLRASATQ